MPTYIKLFKTYNDYIAVKDELPLPNVSVCEEDLDVAYYNPLETRVVAKFNVTSTSNPTKIGHNAYISGFSSIEIDGVMQPSVVSAYTFDTLGEHTVKYVLTDQTSIGEYAFDYCTSLTDIDIPNSVKSIGASAFYYCTGLTSVDIPDSVTSINTSAFQQCYSLTSVTIGSGVTSINNNAFYDCNNLVSMTCNKVSAPTVKNNTFQRIKTSGTLYVPIGSSGYDTWMQNANYYLGKYGWTKVEQ